MTEITFRPHDALEFVQKLIDAQYEQEATPLEKAITKKEYILYDAFDLDELEEIAEHILVYVKYHRQKE